jgi:hypothetical protein
MRLFLGAGAGELVAKAAISPLESPSRMELRCGWDIYQVPNDGSIFDHLLPKAK